MMKKPEDIAEKLLGATYESLDEHTKKVTRHIAGQSILQETRRRNLMQRQR